MAQQYRATCLALAILLPVISATAGYAQDRPRDAFTNLERRLARLESSPGAPIDGRSLARAHREFLSLRNSLSSLNGVELRDARRRLAKLSRRLRELAQTGAASTALIAAAGTGSISGVVTADGGTPLANVAVNAYLIDDGIQTTITDSAGRYVIAGLVAGDYKVFTENSQGFLDELYEGTPCPVRGCSLNSQGTTIVVSDGQTAGGIDFALSPGGRITGRVTDAATGTPIAGAQVEIVSEAVGSTTSVTDADGRYVSGPGLPSGSYLAVGNGPGYMIELFDDIPCSAFFGCDFSNGTPIGVVVGAVTGGIDFALDKGGTISGRVIGSDTGSGIAGVQVVILDTTGQFATEAFTDADGRYQSFDGLTTGSYVLRLFAGLAGYLDEGYDNVLCDNHCFVPAGVTPVPVTVGQDTRGIDFTLDRGGVITGRVVDGNTGQPLPGVDVEAITTTGDPFWNEFGVTDESGVYRIQSLGTGTYRAHASDGNGYLGEVWQELECTGISCGSISGTPIAVQAGLTVAGIDFTPIKGGSITGRVVDHQTKAPLADVEIRVYDSAGRIAFFSSVATDADGRYTVAGLPSGFFFVLADEGSFVARTYVDELYGGLACPASECDVTRGRPVRVTVGKETSSIDFELDRGGRISGQVTDAFTGDPLGTASVGVYDSVTLRFLGSAFVDDSGRYTSREPLPRGQYVVIAAAPGYLPEEYDDVGCESGCNPRLATRVRVTPPAVTTGIDFALSPIAAVVLRVTPR